MNWILKLAFIITPVFANTTFETPHPKTQSSLIVLPIQSSHQLQVKLSDPIYIKDRIVKIKVTGPDTYIVGAKEGFTILRVLNKEYQVQVLNLEDWTHYQSFKSIFKNHPNLNLTYSETGSVITGEILMDEDFVQLLTWLDHSKTKPKLKISFENPELKESGLNILSEKLGLQVSELDEDLNLTLKKSAEAANLKAIDNLGFKVQPENSNGTNLGILDIQFISISDSELKNLSPILPTEFQWTVEQKIKILSQVFNSNYSLTQALNKKSSMINLMLFENEKTEYHSGGEFAMQQRSLYRNDIEWKTFGLFVEALAVSANQTEVNLDLKIKMSYLTSTDQTQPSLNQDRWSQKLRIKKNKSLVVSNSLTNMFVKNKKNHLLFQSIPILNSLFYGKDTSQENTNVYMVIRLNQNNGEI